MGFEVFGEAVEGALDSGLIGDAADFAVPESAEEGVYLGYRFFLSRQRGNRYEGSWMTDAVIPFDIVSL